MSRKKEADATTPCIKKLDPGEWKLIMIMAAPRAVTHDKSSLFILFSENVLSMLGKSWPL